MKSLEGRSRFAPGAGARWQGFRVAAICTMAAVTAFTMLSVFGSGSAAASGKRHKGHKSHHVQHVLFDANGIPSGPFAAFAYGQSSGIYKRYGLSVKEYYAGSTAAALAALEKGQADFAMLLPSALLTAHGLGAGVEAIMSTQNDNSSGIVSLKTSGITKASQFKGKTIGVINSPTNELMTKLYLKKAGGLTTGQYTIEPLSVADVNSALLAGKTQGAEAGLFALPALFAAQGHPTNQFSFGKAGIEEILFVVATRTSLVKHDPKLVEHFVKGTIAALKAGQSKAHIDAAAQATINEAPSGTAPPLSVMKGQIKGYVAAEKSPEDAGKPLGWMSPKDWAKTRKLLVESGVLKASTKLEGAFTDRFFKHEKTH